MDKSIPEVRYDPSVSTDLVLVSIAALRDAFFAGMHDFLINVYSDKDKARLVNSRFEKMVHQFPLGAEDETTR